MDPRLADAIDFTRLSVDPSDYVHDCPSDERETTHRCRCRRRKRRL